MRESLPPPPFFGLARSKTTFSTWVAPKVPLFKIYSDTILFRFSDLARSNLLPFFPVRGRSESPPFSARGHSITSPPPAGPPSRSPLFKPCASDTLRVASILVCLRLVLYDRSERCCKNIEKRLPFSFHCSFRLLDSSDCHVDLLIFNVCFITVS